MRIAKSNGQATYFRSEVYSGLRNQLFLTRVNTARNTLYLGYDAFARLAWAQNWPQVFGFSERHNDGPDMAVEKRFLPDGRYQWIRYVHGPQDDQPLASEVYAPNTTPTPGTGQQFYYHADGEGSIRLLTDASANVVNRYDYDSFGRRLSVVESLPNQPYGWKAREWFPDVELLYNHARWYDPVLGRFTSEDPLGYGGGDFNLYSFAWKNPKKWNDPKGLTAEKGEQIRAAIELVTAVEIGAGAGALVAAAVGSEYGTMAAVAIGQTAHIARLGLELSCTFNLVGDAIAVVDLHQAPVIPDVAARQLALRLAKTPLSQADPLRIRSMTYTLEFETNSLCMWVSLMIWVGVHANTGTGLMR